MEQNELIESHIQLREILESKDAPRIAAAFEDYPPATIIEILDEYDLADVGTILKYPLIEESAKVLAYFPTEKQKNILHTVDKKFASDIFTAMYSDLRADLYQEFSKEEQIALLPYLDKKTREDVIVLSAYPPETAGGIMSTDFATILINMTCEEAIAKIRHDAPSQKMIYYIYVVNDDMEMLGIVTLKNLIMSDPKEKVQNILNDHFVYVDVNEDREEVAKEIEKHDLVAIPVLNALNQLAGIVSHEEAIDIIRAEHTEDMEKFMGISPSQDEETYLEMSTIRHFQRRVIWLVALAAVGLISGVIIHKHQMVLEQLIILALYLPMMTATGGNTGSQSATLVIRSLALGQLSEKDWPRIIFKEFRISFLLSICVAGLIYIKVAFMTTSALLPINMSFPFIAFIISLAIGLQVISSAIIGAGLPMLVNRLGGDPAIAASPAITTTVDITGLLIYFTVASYGLQLSL